MEHAGEIQKLLERLRAGRSGALKNVLEMQTIRASEGKKREGGWLLC